MVECRSGGSGSGRGRGVTWIRKTGRISRSIQADFITSTVAFEGRVFSAQTVSSTLARQNRSLRSGGSVFGPVNFSIPSLGVEHMLGKAQAQIDRDSNADRLRGLRGMVRHRSTDFIDF